jgi:hypothetical protein
MGGESTHRRRPIKEKPPIHLYLNLSFNRVEACGRSRRSFAGIFRPPYLADQPAKTSSPIPVTFSSLRPKGAAGGPDPRSLIQS